ncbi:MAG TPA: mannose-1-phosphate guanylyltransferase/mannose-6-phosphate isomerase, partial [Alphaproteobacteria bacterium]|nr:mannose-1-phosphate guanylyltransferase/mannose-6-phosphate isomerase [Alphaproteobacteria bacterium]
MRIKPVVLSGGSGTRLWPASRKSLPKQFIAFPGTGSLFTRTLERAATISGAATPLVVSSRQHGFLCRKAAQTL